MEIIIENIRTFAGKHEIPLKPITILTGENSSGKTTFLASLSALTSQIGYPVEPLFNTSPYNLGSYDTIATNKGGRFGHAKSFSLGWCQKVGKNKDISELATYSSAVGKIELSKYAFRSPGGDINVCLNDKSENKEYKVEIIIHNKGKDKSSNYSIKKFLKSGFVGGSFPRQIVYQIINQEEQNNNFSYSDLISLIQVKTIEESVSIAPIRTRPERTYDQTTETFSPEGGHIPFVLAKILSESSSNRQNKALASALERFGEESGLFKTIKVKNLGKKGSDPFQVQVNVSGKPVNLIDVGYGVSQALPVLIESVLTSTEKRILIQQPEVHLHPKAQAALGTFFVDLVVNDKKEFVIESHSDYIVDRIRQEIALGRIKNDAVSILYFEREGLETKVYPLSLDKTGNVLNAPLSYRNFFLREEMNLLTRTSK
ncbi:MAG: AAA family ATPase [Pyrinomonadaceae bacterium]|nr:AAA family ATPase [Pyrinomonadaceae bacterium]